LIYDVVIVVFEDKMTQKSERNDIENLPSQKVADALIHLYRGEIQRVNTWRNRLDATPRWAILLAAGIISWVFAVPERSAALILLSIPLVTAFLVLEAHRYQMHEIWRSRLRLIEENFFAYILDHNGALPHKDWTKMLAQDLRVPEHKSTLFHSISVRLKRIYFWIFLTIVLAWGFKVNIHPQHASSLEKFIERSRVGLISGTVILDAVLVFIFAAGAWMVWGKKKEEEEREGEIAEEEPGYEWRREKDSSEK